MTKRFENSTYGIPKGILRLYVLRKGFAKFKIEQQPLSILDASGGIGQFSFGLPKEVIR